MRSPIARTSCCSAAVSGACFAQLADFRALGVALRLELFGFGQRGAALGIEGPELIDVELKSARGQTLGDGVEIGAEEDRSCMRAVSRVDPRSIRGRT